MGFRWVQVRFVFRGSWSCCAQCMATLPVLVGTREILFQHVRTHYMYEYHRIPAFQSCLEDSPRCRRQMELLARNCTESSVSVVCVRCFESQTFCKYCLYAFCLSMPESHTEAEQIYSCQRQLVSVWPQSAHSDSAEWSSSKIAPGGRAPWEVARLQSLHRMVAAHM